MMYKKVYTTILNIVKMYYKTSKNSINLLFRVVKKYNKMYEKSYTVQKIL